MSFLDKIVAAVKGPDKDKDEFGLKEEWKRLHRCKYHGRC